MAETAAERKMSVGEWVQACGVGGVAGCGERERERAQRQRDPLVNFQSLNM